MKVTFLGTSHGVPQGDRFCSSLLLEVQNNAYLIDGGAPVADILIRKNYDFKRIKAIFTSHAHSDHTYGMLQFISLCNWRYKEMNLEIHLTEQSIADAIKNLVLSSEKFFDEERLVSKVVFEGVIYNDGVLKVTAIKTKHMLPYPSYSLVFEADGKRIIYTGDLNASNNAFDFPQMASKENSDLIITEAAHFKAEVILEKTLCCPTKKIAIIHIAGDIDRQIEDIRKANINTNITVIAPNDNDVIDI